MQKQLHVNTNITTDDNIALEFLSNFILKKTYFNLGLLNSLWCVDSYDTLLFHVFICMSLT